MSQGLNLRAVFLRGYRPWIWISMLLYTGIGLIPQYYAMTSVVPAESDLRVSEGRLKVERKGKAGYQFRLEEAGVVSNFTCRYWIGGSHDSCGFPWFVKRGTWFDGKDEAEREAARKRSYVAQQVARVSGKSATIWWFEQPIYFFHTQRRIARLEVSGEEWVGYENTRDGIARSASAAPQWMLVWISVFVLIAAFMEWTTRRLPNSKRVD